MSRGQSPRSILARFYPVMPCGETSIATGRNGGVCGTVSFLLPLREKVARTKSVTDEGLRSVDRPEPLTRLASDDASHPLPQGEREEARALVTAHWMVESVC